MKGEAVRTTVDIPAPLYRKLKRQAGEKARSVRELILIGIERALLQERRPKSKRVRFPLIGSRGPKVRLTNKRMYELIEFP